MRIAQHHRQQSGGIGRGSSCAVAECLDYWKEKQVAKGVCQIWNMNASPVLMPPTLGENDRLRLQSSMCTSQLSSLRLVNHRRLLRCCGLLTLTVSQGQQGEGGLPAAYFLVAGFAGICGGEFQVSILALAQTGAPCSQDSSGCNARMKMIRGA